MELFLNRWIFSFVEKTATGFDVFTDGPEIVKLKVLEI